jgi:exo-1,4-beta-D-glucosaminidase
MSRVRMLLAVLGVVLVGAPAARADVSTIGLHGWQVQSSAVVLEDGATISQPAYAAGGWLRVRPDDAGAPGTEVGALLQNGRCPGVFFSTRMRECFGYMSQIGPVTINRFAVPWWFRTTFRSSARHTQLIVSGVVGAAQVWVDGHRIGVAQGDYTRFVFDITRLLRRGANAVALELEPNNPMTMFTLDNVDWTQIPPDNNTGLQFPVQLHTSGAVGIGDAHVVQADAPDFSRADLTLKAAVSNFTAKARCAAVTATVTAPDGQRAWHVTQSLTLPPGATREVSLPLTLVHPRVWWPYQMGGQPLYGLSMAVSAGGRIADRAQETFAVRTVSTRLVGPSRLTPSGSRQFLVNGRPFVFRGGGWSEDLFLRYSAADIANQIALIRNLGLNGIRTEGKQMPADFYEQMDRAGVLIDAGYQCCDAWQLQDSGLTSPHDLDLLGLSALTIGQNLRDHPSVLNFSWSDDQPTDAQERVSLAGFARADFADPLIASAEYKASPLLGPSGEKEGPYDWVPPGYWYDRTHYAAGDPTRTNVGGAWGFDSEASAGDTVPTLDSIARFLSRREQRELWRNPDYNQYHLNYEPGLPNPDTNGGYSFGTLHDLDRAIAARYGRWSSLESYVEEAQVQNYETQRAEFEAYIDHSADAEAPSTGIVYWQLNKGWPTLLWDLYNNDYDQAGSYFGAQEANQPLHALYAYDTGQVTVDNLGPSTEGGLSVESRVYDLGGHLLDDRTSAPLSLPSQGVRTGVLTPAVPAIAHRPTVYFVELLLRSRGALADRNVYWLSTQPDIVDWPRTIGLPQATMTQYAALEGLKRLAPATLAVTAHSVAGATTVTITNVGRSVAFFIRTDVRRGPRGPEVLPAFWTSNDTTLWPGESETVEVSYRAAELHSAAPVVTVSAWNSATLTVGAP